MFIIHGKVDTLIPYAHAEELYNACPTETYLHMPEKMDHNDFHLDQDLIEPLRNFFRKIETKKKEQLKVDLGEESESEEEKKTPEKDLQEVNLF